MKRYNSTELSDKLIYQKRIDDVFMLSVYTVSRIGAIHFIMEPFSNSKVENYEG